MLHAHRSATRSTNNRRHVIAVALLLSLVMVVTASGCRREPPEAALRKTIAELQGAIDARDAGDVAALLSDDFVGPGGMDRDATRRYAAVVLMRHQAISTTIGPLDIALQDDHARVRFTAALTGGDGGLLPDAARVREVDTGWRLESGEWRLLSATWDD